MEISGFTFAHNAIDSGYPIIEAIDAVMSWVDSLYVVDMQSTDTTRQVLKKWALILSRASGAIWAARY